MYIDNAKKCNDCDVSLVREYNTNINVKVIVLNVSIKNRAKDLYIWKSTIFFLLLKS